MVKKLGLGSTRSRRTIYLVSTAGHPNYGDEVILRRWLRLLARTEPDADVWVDSPAPGPTATLFAGEHPRLRTTDTIYRLAWEAPEEKARDAAEFVRLALDEPGEAPRWIPGIELLRTVDVFHVVGGGYVNTIWPRHLGVVAAASWVSRNTRARVGATGLGLLPCTDDALDVWREAAPRFDVLTVRDSASAELLTGLGRPTEPSPDDVFLGGLRSTYRPRADRSPDLMVCVQSDMYTGPYEPVIDLVRTVLRDWGAASRSVGFVECIPRGDRVVYDALREELPHARFYPLWEVLADGFPARPGQRWISSRYHPHILAASAGAEGVALSLSDDYYGVKHAAVRDLGSEWSVVRLGDTITDPGPAGTLPERAEQYAAELLRTARELYRP